ncbi:hypothetical protein EWM64_g9609 [Hericium alpestre]|uniref:Adenylate kinase active site lid domain-containing protein n=1 Tax=Hericium alpestre TaxID=135208 RepID=A0A4Y9ZIC1_9AGAM|nr:hypothetical protein EWM64_g9609 [Hericium alpestre]
MADASNKTIFDSSKITVIFILGGPGAGPPPIRIRELIRTCIREGTIVPMEVTIKLLENAMRAAVEERDGKGLGWADGRGRFLIDGFPRKMDQALKFEEDVCVSGLTIFFTTTEEVMLKRLLVRGETSGREDDNVESIKKRFRTYKDQTMPVIEHYRTQQKVAEIDSTGSVEEVHAKASVIINRLFAGEPTVNVTI